MGLKISVIIPVYNAEKYLYQCIESVVTQSYKNIEIILVDDGSSDNSLQICDEFAKDDIRVTVIHKENGGSSDARNTGIRVASGDYLMFLDSDDYWDGNDCIEHIINYINESKADVLLFGYKKYFEKTKSIENVSCIGDREYVINNSKEKVFDYLTEKNLYIASSGSKVIKRNIIITNDIFFEKGATSEDIEWSARIAIVAKQFDYYPRNIYIYRQRKGSITKTIKIENVICLQNNLALCVNYGEQMRDTNFYNYYMSYISYQYVTLLANSLNLTKVERKEIRDDMVKYAFLLKYGKNKKVKIVRIAKNIFGFTGMYFLLQRFYSLKKEV